MAPAFRIQSKHILLTYPHAEFNHEQFYEFFRTKLPIKHCIVARENHADGNPHQHVYLALESKPNIRDVRYFDYESNHPNIQSVKNIPATINYVKKDDNYTEFGGEQTENLYDLAKSMEYEQFMHYCITKKIPFGYAQDAVRRAHSVDTTIHPDTPIEGTISEKLNWVTFNPEERKSILLVGPSGIGKTTWALQNAPKPALLVTHIDDLKQFKANFHKSIIFDDMSFTHLHTEAQIHIVDRDLPRSIHVRYGIVRIPAKIVKIFTNNVPPVEYTNPAINRRINKIDLY